MAYEDRFEGRSHVFPHKVVNFGARPLPVPGAGHVLCASALLPFRLADGDPATPNEYFEAVASCAGEDAVPDSMAPVPGAEVLVLGPAAPVAGEDGRRAEVRCGGLRCRLLLRPDPEAAGAPLPLGPEAAVWHREDNPWGRGGPDGGGPALIALANDPGRPVWCGPTPSLHPARARLMGVSAQTDSGGWPGDARQEALFESHPAFWTESLHPGDPLRVVGLGELDVDIELPPYRPNLASARLPDGRWVAESARIHTVVLLPAAGLGAVIWRASIALGGDILGEKVAALVFALEDAGAPERDAEALGEIAERRWLDAAAALDDRPLLPAALAAAAAPPAADPAVFEDRHAAAEDWARKEMGADNIENPFAGDPAPVRELGETLDGGAIDPAPDMDATANIAGKALRDAKQRHEQAGFTEPDLEKQREPEVRGNALEGEIGERLDAPWRAPQERAVFASLAQAPPDAGVDSKALMNRLATARIASLEPTLFWPALEPGEAERFGAAALERFRGADPERHIDISSAAVAAPAGDGPARVEGRTFDGLLAEETAWRDIEFRGCTFLKSSFVRARFEHCAFVGCRFEGVNLSSAHLEEVEFRDCVFSDQVLNGMNWIEVRLEQCEFRSVTFMDWAVRDTVFEGGLWEQVQLSDCLLAKVTFRDTAHRDVIWTMVHAPYLRFERVSLHKVWATATGCPESDFESVEADTCGFIGGVFFHRSRFVDTRFTQTGFTMAFFNEARFAEDCAFDRCDLSSAVFSEARAANLRFLNCSMVSTVWDGGVDATGAWFLGCVLRGVDFTDTRLMNAVFAGADLEGAKLDDRLTAGADFRGTSRGEGEDGG